MSERRFEHIPEQYIILDSFELGFTKAEMSTLRQMWKEGRSLEEIIHKLRPTEKGCFEVALAITDQLYKGNIKAREKGILIGQI